MSSFDTNELLASKWLDKSDVPQQGVDLIIRCITQEFIGDDMEDKLAMHFHGSYKPLLLNRTNMRIAASLYGPKTDNWLNQPICVYSDPTISFAGRLTGGVRLRMPQQAPARAATPPPAPAGWPQPGNNMGAPPAEYATAAGGRPIKPIDDLADSIPF